MKPGVVVRIFPDVAARRRAPRLYPAIQLFPPPNFTDRWIYAISFTNGITKVGSTRDPRERIRTHVRAASGAVNWVHLFGRWTGRVDHFCRQAERDACRRIGLIATSQHGNEWFEGVSREDVFRCVRSAEAENREFVRMEAEREALRRRPRKRAKGAAA